MHLSLPDRTVIEAGYDSVADGLAEVGVRVVEVHVDEGCEATSLGDPSAPRYLLTDARTARSYREQLYHLGVSVAALCLDPLPADGDASPAEGLSSALEAARLVGAGVVIVPVVVEQTDPQTTPPAVQRVLRVLEPAADQRRDRLPAVAIEPRGDPTAFGALLPALLPHVEVGALGLVLAPGEFYRAGHPLSVVRDMVRRFAPFTRHVRCGNLVRPTGCQDEAYGTGAHWARPASLSAGDIDYAWVAAALGRSGYAGALSLACEFAEAEVVTGRQVQLKADVRHLSEILGDTLPAGR